MLIRDSLEAHPSLRNWTHLYYYLLSASIVILYRLNQSPFDHRAREYIRLCGFATEAFEWIRSLGGSGLPVSRNWLTSAKIITAIKNSLDQWNDRKTKMQGVGRKREREPSPVESEQDVSTPGDNLRPRSRAELGTSFVFPTPDLYSFNEFYANGMPFPAPFPAPYDISALLHPNPVQASTSGQFRFAGAASTRFEGVKSAGAPGEPTRSRSDDDESSSGFSSDPRIMRNFGINRESHGWK